MADLRPKRVRRKLPSHVTSEQPKTPERKYDYQRVAEEAAVVRHFEALGGVVIRPPRNTGFGGPE